MSMNAYPDLPIVFVIGPTASGKSRFMKKLLENGVCEYVSTGLDCDAAIIARNTYFLVIDNLDLMAKLTTPDGIIMFSPSSYEDSIVQRICGNVRTCFVWSFVDETEGRRAQKGGEIYNWKFESSEWNKSQHVLEISSISGYNIEKPLEYLFPKQTIPHGP